MSAKTRAEFALSIDSEIEKNTKYWNKVNQFQKEQKRKKKRKLREDDFINLGIFKTLETNIEFKPKSYNKEVQELEYFQTKYFKYEAPVWALLIVKTIHDKFVKDGKTCEIGTSQPYFVNDLYKDSVFYCVSEMDLIEAISNGSSIRKLLAEYLNKKECHLFLKSKEETLKAAYVEAKLLANNVNKQLIKFILTRNFVLEKCTSVISTELLKFIQKNNILDYKEFSEILDYIQNHFGWDYTSLSYYDTKPKSLERRKEIETFFKRSYRRMKEESDLWHAQRVFTKAGMPVKWAGTFEEFKIEEQNGTWTFNEITTTVALVKEGNSMSHCVGSYATACARGSTAIVSLKYQGERQVTLEINTRTGTVVQAKQKYNKSVTQNQFKAIQLFAERNKLTVATYL